MFTNYDNLRAGTDSGDISEDPFNPRFRQIPDNPKIDTGLLPLLGIRYSDGEITICVISEKESYLDLGNVLQLSKNSPIGKFYCANRGKIKIGDRLPIDGEIVKIGTSQLKKIKL